MSETLLQGVTNAYGRIPKASIGDVCVFEIDDRYYVVEVCDYQVKSVGPDNPAEGGRWFGNGLSNTAIKYVSRGRSRSAALAMLRAAIAKAKP